MHYLLFYDKAADYALRQAPLQAAHRDYLGAAAARGLLLLGGSLEHPEDHAAVLLCRADSAGVVEAFAAGDPYVVNGVVIRWRVRRWDTVVGAGLGLEPP